MTFKTLISQKSIQKRNRVLSQEIQRYYSQKEWILLGLMNGSLYFLPDLLRHLPPQTPMETWKVTSYLGTQSTGKLRGIPRSCPPLKNKHVLIVDDILDTGSTLFEVRHAVEKMGALSVRIAVLLSKNVRRQKNVKVHWVGFKIPNRFVVGYGLDLDGKYRNLPDIQEIQP